MDGDHRNTEEERNLMLSLLEEGCPTSRRFTATGPAVRSACNGRVALSRRPDPSWRGSPKPVEDASSPRRSTVIRGGGARVRFPSAPGSGATVRELDEIPGVGAPIPPQDGPACPLPGQSRDGEAPPSQGQSRVVLQNTVGSQSRTND
jgi:hypothetical protein